MDQPKELTNQIFGIRKCKSEKINPRLRPNSKNQQRDAVYDIGRFAR